MIDTVSKVVIQVEDQERAKAFWTKTMGFALVQDVPYGDERSLSRCGRPAGRAWSWSFGLGSPRRPVSPELPSSDVMFGCLDLLSTYQELSPRGAVFPQPPVRQPLGWSMFSDTVGNRFALGQKEPASTPDVESTTAAPAYE